MKKPAPISSFLTSQVTPFFFSVHGKPAPIFSVHAAPASLHLIVAVIYRSTVHATPPWPMLLLRSPEHSTRLLRSLEASTLLLSLGLAFILDISTVNVNIGYRILLIAHNNSKVASILFLGMASDGTKRSQVSSGPPRNINVQKFADSLASELDSLHSILHHVGVPLSQPMAPVTYMWKPYPNHDREGDGNFQNAVECNDPHVCHSLFRQLWLWMHASAFDEGYNALKLACQKQVWN
ncbi:hypothetical protein LWI28_006760 [Acer negundo]|uniref:Uncharacterized protein n=1 Tax=Acer negundo TaxID=4023 RepID=A0AAD5IQQ2_ACENE|nr:hypothetical protein LWI28_006760 [Acer negundo]